VTISELRRLLGKKKPEQCDVYLWIEATPGQVNGIRISRTVALRLLKGIAGDRQAKAHATGRALHVGMFG
jgi:hypothetical protein